MKYLLILLICLLAFAPAAAHDPFTEAEDWGDFDQPNQLEDASISYALYGYLDENDIDVFALEVEQGDLIRVELLVPVCGEHYEAFYPRFVLVGETADPTLAAIDLPFELPEGLGVMADLSSDARAEAPAATDEPRPTFVEPFGGTAFYEAPRLDMDAPAAGVYYVVVYAPEGETGDYTLATGYREVFSSDAGRMLNAVASIRAGDWLHRRCDLPPDDPEAMIEHAHEHDDH